MDFVEYSEFNFHLEFIAHQGKNSYDLNISIEPNVLINRFDFIEDAKSSIKNDIQVISNIGIQNIDIKPNYDRFQIINSAIQPILTDWEEINELQSELIQNLKRAKNDVDARNIGNSCRILLDKLTSYIFDNKRHIAPKEVNLGGDKFKNRLHTYIKNELSGKSNKELRLFSESAVSIAERTIDLSNNVTHNKKADKFLAEYCSIATIGVISLIKMISNLD